MADEHTARRIKQLLIAPQLLVAMFKEMREPVRLSSSGLPANARMLSCQYDAARNCIRLLVYSEAFAVVPSNQEPPYLDVTFTRHDDALAVKVEGLA